MDNTNTTTRLAPHVTLRIKRPALILIICEFLLSRAVLSGSELASSSALNTIHYRLAVLSCEACLLWF